MDNFESMLPKYENICLIDFGTTHTILKNEKYFSHLSMSKINVTTIFGSTNMIEGFGRAIVILSKGTKFIINNATFFPKSRRNSLSFENICEMVIISIQWMK